MKIFTNGNSAWSTKVNFVDENNVVLGYDLAQHCCEYANWFIADKPILEQPKDRKQDLNQPLEGWDDWRFDKDYFHRAPADNADILDYCSDIAIFRITDGKEEKFIHLFNCHNGYYGHGFSFKEGNECIREESL